MLISLILGLLIGAVSVIFALQNIFAVTVTFFAWEITASLALLIAIAIVAGLFIAALISIPDAIRNTIDNSRLRKENKRLAQELEDLQKLNHKSDSAVITDPEVPPTTVM